uniref:50S ribosomal protein L19, chloroplastic n=1 Tax=Theileria annulata TaxID=5874 RepID=A0A3B0NI16_THEAN
MFSHSGINLRRIYSIYRVDLVFKINEPKFQNLTFYNKQYSCFNFKPVGFVFSAKNPNDSKTDSSARNRVQSRGIRTRAVVSNFDSTHYVVTNPNTAKNWPPEHDHGSPISRERCKKLMCELNELEIERLEKMRKFNMPELNLGELVEVKYELSRTQQTFAIFTGYCVDIRNRGLNSSFSLKNAFDGVGVTQLFPLYSPRILNVKVVKSLNKGERSDYKPLTRDYRYKFHYNVRHRFSKKSGVHKPGIRSFEIRLKNRITRLKQSYYRMRMEAGLPPYIWPGPYNINTRKRSKYKFTAILLVYIRKLEVKCTEELGCTAWMSNEHGVKSLVRGGRGQLGEGISYQALITLINSQNNFYSFM